MGCYYTYNGASAATIEDLVSVLLKTGAALSDDVFIGNHDYIVHKSNSVDNTTDVLKQAEAAYNKHENDASGVTSVINNTIYGSKEFELKDDYKDSMLSDNANLLKRVSVFLKDFGTLVHKAISDLYTNKNIDDGKFSVELKNLAKTLLDNITPSMEKIAYGLGADTINVINFAKYLRSDVSNLDLTNQIRNLAMEIKSRYQGAVVLSEVHICTNPDVEKNLMKGIIDLLVVKDNGEVVIVDFKTSLGYNASISLKNKNYRYGLLQAYKAILHSWGIDPKLVSCENVPIKFKLVSGNQYKIEAADIGVNPENIVDSAGRSEIRNILNKFFPPKATITSEEIHNHVNTIKQLHAAFYDDAMLKRITVDSLRGRIIDKAKNKLNLYITSESKLCKLILDGDKIKGFDYSDSTELVFEKTVDDLIEAELAAIEERGKNQVLNMIDILLSKSLEGLRSYISYDLKASNALWMNMYKYFSDSWEYQPRADLEEFGIICMKNTVANTYEFIQLVTESGSLNYSKDPNSNILDLIITDKNALEKYRESSNLLRPSIGNIYLMRAAIALAQLNGAYKEVTSIDNIKVLSVINGTQANITLDVDKLQNTLHILQLCCRDNPSLANSLLFTDIYNKFKTYSFSDYNSMLENMVVDALKVGAIEFADDNLKLSDWLDKQSISAKLEALDLILLYIESHEHYGRIIKSAKDALGDIKGDDPIIHMYNLIRMYKNALYGLVEDNAHEINSYGISFKESIVAGINLLAKALIAEFTTHGLQLTGFALGLEASTAYASPSTLILRFLHFYNTATALILKEATDEINELNIATLKFLKNYVPVVELYANHNDIYSALFLLENGVINLDMLFKNPYIEDSKLSPDQREYLEVVLWTINRHRMYEIDPKTKKMSYTELKESKDFEKYKNAISINNTYLEIPLKLRDGFSTTFTSFVSVIKGKRTLKEFTEKEITKFRARIELSLLDEDQLSARDKAEKAHKYHNYYKEGLKIRTNRIEKNQPLDWEWNINKLCVDYVLADIKEIYFNKLLKVADNLIATITILEQVTGLDLSKLVEALHNRIKVSIYNKTLVDEDFNDVVASMGLLKSGIALAKIAARPALFMKEMLLGRIRNTAAILANQVKNDDKITMEHLMSAAAEVFGPNFAGDIGAKLFGSRGRGEKTIVDLLNDTYTINDRDFSVISSKLSYDDYGFHNFGLRMLYLNTIAPDWFNRMILMIAKMKADGTWEAHKNVDGKLVYDPSKDARIKEFWNNRHKPKNTKEYKKAEAYYILRMLLFEREGWKNEDGSDLQYSNGHYDPFPRCYTTLEEESLKELIGLIYGYYSHQERANMQKGLWWTMYTEFLTFLPAEIRRYLAIGTESSIIKTVHLKDPISGKLLYWKEVKDELGDTLQEKTTEEVDDLGNHLSPVLVTLDDPYEGLLISTAKTVGLLCRGDIKHIVENPQLLKNSYLFLFNTLFGMLIALIISSLSGTIKDAGPLAQNVANVALKTGNELNMINTLSNTVGDLGLVGTKFILDTFNNAFKVAVNENYSLYDLSEAAFPIVKEIPLNLELS